MISKNIRYLRKSLNLSQEAFAKKFNLTRGKIDSYERNIAEPAFETQKTIADYFGYTVEEINSLELKASNVNRKTDVSIMLKDEIIENLKEENKFLKGMIEKLMKALSEKP